MLPLPHAPLKLLVVDDDRNTRELLCDALEIRGACVRASATANEAQQLLAAWHPDLMISDIGMPCVDGYELIRRVRHLPADQGGTTPAIACTGHARAEDRARAMYAGYDAVVAKPVDLDVLIDTIVHVAGVRGGGPDDEGAPADGA
jgi:CheY-like chemotaxis protein